MFGPGSSTLNLARQPCTQAPPKAGLGYSTVFAKRAGSHISSASSEASGRVRLLRSLTHPEARRRNVRGRPPPRRVVTKARTLKPRAKVLEEHRRRRYLRCRSVVAVA